MIENARQARHFTMLDILALIFAAGIAITGDTAWALEPPTAEGMEALAGSPQGAIQIQKAKELGNHRVDPYRLKRALVRIHRLQLEEQGASLEQVEAIAPMPAPPPAWRGMPSVGAVRILALLIEFQDHAHTSTQADVHSRLFGSGNPADMPVESLASYYDRASYQQLDLSNGNTLGWYQTAYNRTAVNQTRTGRENLIKEVLNHYDSNGHDFSQYDNNGDGQIDYFVVIWTGPDNGWANFWWGYQTDFSDAGYTLDGVSLGKYSWQWESNPAGGAFNPRVVIHETGHALGLPDFYDYDGAVGPDGGVGGLDMMDGNRGDHGAFSKWILEWITPEFVTGGTKTRILHASGTSRDAVLVWPNSADIFGEYFIAQNRERIGNDSARMPGDGMLIWHIDARLNSSNTDFLYDNSFTDHKLIRLMEADGLEQISAGGAGDAGDYYDAGDRLDQVSTPSSKRYDGTNTGVSIFDFSASGPQMTATFKIAGTLGLRSVINNLAYNAGGWRVERHPRMLGDVDGDGRDDIVAFGNASVFVALGEDVRN